MISNIHRRTSAITAIEKDAKFLGKNEILEFRMLGSKKRQHEYLAGRVLGKKLLGNLCDQSPTRIEILSRGRNGRPSRPRILISGDPTDCQISISHNYGKVMVAATTRTDLRIGCDLEGVQTLNSGSLQMWFTDFERSWLAPFDPSKASVLWSGKEAAYKAMNQSESFVPGRFEIRPIANLDWECTYYHEQQEYVCRLNVFETAREVAVIAAYDLEVTSND